MPLTPLEVKIKWSFLQPRVAGFSDLSIPEASFSTYSEGIACEHNMNNIKDRKEHQHESQHSRAWPCSWRYCVAFALTFRVSRGPRNRRTHRNRGRTFRRQQARLG